jgi:hypothetical protein
VYIDSPELHLLDLVIRPIYGTGCGRLWLLLVVKVFLNVLWNQLIRAFSAYGSILMYFQCAYVTVKLPCSNGSLRSVEIPSFEKGVIYVEPLDLGFFLFGQGVVALLEFFGQEVFVEGVLTKIGQLWAKVRQLIITGFFGGWTLAHSSGQ